MGATDVIAMQKCYNSIFTKMGELRLPCKYFHARLFQPVQCARNACTTAENNINKG